MRRRDFVGMLAAAMAFGTAAEAKDYAKDILRQLQRNGYSVVSVSQTMLGRTRIRAAKGGGEREIILNAATGEILRDVWILARNDGGSGSLDDDDDGDKDRDDDDDDDDDDRGGNSGHGGGNSGKGGGGDDDDDGD